MHFILMKRDFFLSKNFLSFILDFFCDMDYSLGDRVKILDF